MLIEGPVNGIHDTGLISGWNWMTRKLVFVLVCKYAKVSVVSILLKTPFFKHPEKRGFQQNLLRNQTFISASHRSAVRPKPLLEFMPVSGCFGQ